MTACFVVVVVVVGGRCGSEFSELRTFAHFTFTFTYKSLADETRDFLLGTIGSGVERIREILRSFLTALFNWNTVGK